MIGPLYTPERLAYIESKAAESRRLAYALTRTLPVSGESVGRRWTAYQTLGRPMIAADLGLEE